MSRSLNLQSRRSAYRTKKYLKSSAGLDIGTLLDEGWGRLDLCLQGPKFDTTFVYFKPSSAKFCDSYRV